VVVRHRGARCAAAGYGFQLTFFRSRPGIAEDLQSPIAASQILFAHAAVTRPGERLLHAERAGRANLGAGFSTTDCDVHIGAWRMQRLDTADGEQFRLIAPDPAFTLDLRLKPSQPLLPQGDAGWSQKGPRPELASHYLSWPQLQVDGSLTLDGKRHTARGRAWFDHEWSSEVLGAGSVGWDWIGINLDDGGALMAFRIRDAGGGTVYAHAALRDAGGRVTQFDPRRGRLRTPAALDLAAQWRPLSGSDGGPLRSAPDRNRTRAGRPGNHRAAPPARQLLGGPGGDSRYPHGSRLLSNSRAIPPR
jgi:predicted secreted hydrolase